MAFVRQAPDRLRHLPWRRRHHLVVLDRLPLELGLVAVTSITAVRIGSFCRHRFTPILRRASEYLEIGKHPASRFGVAALYTAGGHGSPWSSSLMLSANS